MATLEEQAAEAAGLSFFQSMFKAGKARVSAGDAVVLRIGGDDLFLTAERVVIGTVEGETLLPLEVFDVQEGQTIPVPLPVGFRGDLHAFITDDDVPVVTEANFDTEQAENRARNLNAQADAEPGTAEKLADNFGSAFGVNVGVGLVVTMVIGLGALYYVTKTKG